MSTPRILAIVPARGGSQGMPGKNLLEVAGKPLLGWTFDAASRCARLTRTILSSDSEEICAAARSLGLEVPFVRPAELARNDTPGIEPVLHALDVLEEDFDYVVLLQPTSPLRLAADIDAALDQCLQGGAPACVSVSEVEPSPYWSFVLGEQGRLKPLIESSRRFTRRQDLPAVYGLNGAVYVAEVEWLRRERSFVTSETAASVMPRERAADLDDDLDLVLIEALLARR